MQRLVSLNHTLVRSPLLCGLFGQVRTQHSQFGMDQDNQSKRVWVRSSSNWNLPWFDCREKMVWPGTDPTVWKQVFWVSVSLFLEMQSKLNCRAVELQKWCKYLDWVTNHSLVWFVDHYMSGELNKWQTTSTTGLVRGIIQANHLDLSLHNIVCTVWKKKTLLLVAFAEIAAVQTYCREKINLPLCH